MVLYLGMVHLDSTTWGHCHVVSYHLKCFRVAVCLDSLDVAMSGHQVEPCPS